MRIRKLKVEKILSFGPVQELSDFTFFNLFIGKNGSGKTNALKIIKGLPISYRQSDQKITVEQYTTSEWKNVSIPNLKKINAYVPSISLDYYINREGYYSFEGLLQLVYEDTQYHQEDAEDKNIKFVGGLYSGGSIYYQNGDLNFLEKNIEHLEVPETELEFFKDLSFFMGSKAIETGNLTLLNFGLSYIFESLYKFKPDGTFTHVVVSSNTSGTITEDNTSNLPSGVLNCAKILTRYFMTQASIILIDEPELHLEPRIIRRFFHFLVWLNVRQKTDRTTQEESLFSVVEKLKNSGYSIHKDGVSRSKWAVFYYRSGKPRYIDIPSAKVRYNFQKQLFFASHSSVLINEFLNLRTSSTIFEFNNSQIEYNQVDPGYIDNPPKTVKVKGYFTTVKKIHSDAYSILDNLGSKGSDLLQANGIIWVEGPSDVIYIKKWLEMYESENKKSHFESGREYEFQMFGGTLLDSLCLIKSGGNEEEEYKKLVSMFSFSRNAFVIMDSDAVFKDDGIIADKSKFKNAKQFIKKQFESFKEKGRNNIELWYKEGNAEIRTIESYLDHESRKMNNDNKSWTKKIAAQKITESWGDNKKLDDFPNNLKKEIKILYDTIAKWNE